MVLVDQVHYIASFACMGVVYCYITPVLLCRGRSLIDKCRPFLPRHVKRPDAACAHLACLTSDVYVVRPLA